MMKKLLTQASLVFAFAFLLNFLWESIHAVLFYTGHQTMESSFFVRMISYVSFVDALLILGIFISGSILWREFEWIKKYDSRKISYTAIVGFLIASIIEAKALFFKQWSYNELMPTIFGMGISPLIQLSITGILAMWVSSEILKNRKI